LERSRADTEQIREEVTQLYRLRRHTVFRSLTVYIRNPAVAEEVTQEAFLRLYQHLIAGHAITEAIAWTVAVARNLAVDWLRGSQREQPVSRQSWLSLVETQCPDDASLERDLIERETENRLRVLANRLPEAQRRCVELYARELTFKEIAEVMGIPYHRALMLTKDGLRRMKYLARKRS
jgi:RNA polymerase sigma-70 factor (ECF subfamily)